MQNNNKNNCNKDDIIKLQQNIDQLMYLEELQWA